MSDCRKKFKARVHEVKQLLDANLLSQFIQHVHACTNEQLEEDLCAIILDRHLKILGRMVAMVRGLSSEKLAIHGTTNELIGKKLDRITAKVGDHMPRRWRQAKKTEAHARF